MNVLIVASECVPFAKTGGLADVAGSLPGPLSKLGHNISLMMPLYRSVREAGFNPKPLGIKLRIALGDKPIRGGVSKLVLPGTSTMVYFIDCPELYDREELYGTLRGDYEDNCQRFIFFSRAVIEATEALGLKPDIFHLNDWQTALIAVYLKTICAGNPVAAAKTLLTVHNLAYQGLFWHLDMPLTGLDWKHFNMHELEFYGRLNLLKGGLVYADRLSTVSQRYAAEIQTADYGCGLDELLADRSKELSGIVNGIDYDIWSPAADEMIAASYSVKEMAGKAKCKAALQKVSGLPVKKNVPLVGMVSRLDDQKGFDLIAKSIPVLMKWDMQLVVLGTGHENHHKLLKKIGREYPDRTGMHITFSNELAHQIEAGSDIFLMPSRFEPCGLNQLYSLAYGTVPVVRETGGLADTITDATDENVASGVANGFTFRKHTPKAMLDALRRALDAWGDKKFWKKIVATGMSQDWSWAESARKYDRLYESMKG